jgi:hypothetical protein
MLDTHPLEPAGPDGFCRALEEIFSRMTVLPTATIADLCGLSPVILSFVREKKPFARNSAMLSSALRGLTLP